jgi:hypothetical protein
MTPCCYMGKRAWAEAWAARLQSRVGTTMPDGRVITAIRAQGYGESHGWLWSPWWCVIEEWQYIGNGSLGTFGENTALLLERRMPP